MIERLSRSIRAMRALGLVALVVAFAVGGLAIERSLDGAHSAQQRLEQSYEIIDQIASLRISLLRHRSVVYAVIVQDAGPGMGELQAARDQIDSKLERLKGLVADNPDQLAKLAIFVDGFKRLRAMSDKLFALSREDEPLLALRRRFEAVGGVRPLIRQLDSFEAEERRLLHARADSDRASSARTNELMITIFVGAVLTGTLAFVFLVRQLDANLMRNRDLRRAKDETDALNWALAKSESHLQAILDNAQDAIFVATCKGGVRLANAACERLFGVSRDGLLGCGAGDLLPGIEVDGGHVRVMAARRPGGSEFPAELSVGAYDLDGEDGRVFVLRDVTERQRLERLKAEFVSTVSHELRTPLTSIRASLGLLLASVVDQMPERAQKLVNIAYRSSLRLTGLVNDLLDIDRIESEGSRLDHRLLDLCPLVGQAIDQSRDLAVEHGVELELVLSPGGPLEVVGDRIRLRQALGNLISNAVKFSPAGGKVELSLSREGEEARIAVRDFGPGIQEEFKPHIFDRFAQADSSDIRRTGGAGLGLHIARAIIRRHGGRIGFESPLPEGGSRFWFTVPLVLDPRAGGGLAGQGEPDAARSAESTTADRSRPRSATGRIGPGEEGGLPRILYVEDDADMIAVVAVVLASAVEIVPARSLSEARTRLREERIALAIIDVELPDGSGYELLDAIRSLTPPPPILVLSATECEEPYAGAVSAALVKGRFDHQELFRTVQELLGERSRTPFRQADEDAQPPPPAGSA